MDNLRWDWSKMNNKVEKCKFYNDHDCNVPECDELLDERFLPVYTCDERKDCAYKKYSSCIFFQNGDCGMCRVEDGEEYYFDGLAKCNNNPNCYYKQLLAEQAKNKKLVEEKAIKDKMIELMLKEINCNYTGNSPNPHSRCKYPKCDECKTYFYKKQAQQALNEVNK